MFGIVLSAVLLQILQTRVRRKRRARRLGGGDGPAGKAALGGEAGLEERVI